MRISRRNLFRAALASVPGGLGYAGLGEPNWLQVTQRKIRVAAKPLPAPVRIVQLSDFHLSEDVPLSLIARAIKLGIEQKPDIICFTGDFVTRWLSQETEYSKELRKLADAAPTFVSLGNHDGGLWAGRCHGYEATTDIIKFATASGLRVLHNESTVIRIGETNLRLSGLGDSWSGEFKPADVFGGIDAAAAHAHVLMSHNPDTKDDLKDFAWNLLLCGHTHGGQVSLPFLGGGLFAPVRDRRYISGLYNWEGHHIFITRGVGNIHGIRFNCRPEVAVLTLV
jgi:predicted MPP superfamily phosphohydrolase